MDIEQIRNINIVGNMDDNYHDDNNDNHNDNKRNVDTDKVLDPIILDKNPKEHVLIKRRSKKIENIIEDFIRPVSPVMNMDIDMNTLHRNMKTKCTIPHCPKHHPAAKFNESKYLIKDIKCIRSKKIEN